MDSLYRYSEDVLAPTKEQISFIRSKIRRIRTVLTRNATLEPKEVHTGGSLEKGTMLRYKPDADIVCIYNRSAEVAANWRKLVTLVHKDLEQNFPNMEIEEAGRLAIHLKAEYRENDKKQVINFDVVPCYYVNSPAVMKGHVGSKLYTAITTIWHSHYICARYKKLPYFINVVRLLKDWRNEQKVPFLKSIHLELITADTYDCNREEIPSLRDEHIPWLFDQCLDDIIDTLDGYPVLPYNWKYCKEDDFAERYTSPVLIDPANPDDNLLSGIDKADVKKIRMKIKATRKNLKEINYSAIFNRQRLLKDYSFN
jgi:RNA polymerase subunit RPABC4/transcription elongation factor Spt4